MLQLKFYYIRPFVFAQHWLYNYLASWLLWHVGGFLFARFSSNSRAQPEIPKLIKTQTKLYMVSFSTFPLTTAATFRASFFSPFPYQRPLPSGQAFFHFFLKRSLPSTPASFPLFHFSGRYLQGQLFLHFYFSAPLPSRPARKTIHNLWCRRQVIGPGSLT